MNLAAATSGALSGLAVSGLGFSGLSLLAAAAVLPAGLSVLTFGRRRRARPAAADS